jgi:hypothetical protein
VFILSAPSALSSCLLRLLPALSLPPFTPYRLAHVAHVAHVCLRRRFAWRESPFAGSPDASIAARSIRHVAASLGASRRRLAYATLSLRMGLVYDGLSHDAP